MAALESGSGRGSRRVRRALALLALLPGALASADEGTPPADPGDLPEPTLEAFMAGMASTPGVVARFREVKELGLLSVPLESRGTLYFVPPDRLARITTEPAPTRLVIDGDRFAYRDEAGGEVAEVDANPLAREFVRSFIVLFNGDLDALRERYEPDFEVEGARWTLRLRPRSRPLADFVEGVTLEGAGRALRRIEMRETDGDRTVTTLDHVQVDHRFAPSELERIFAVPEEAGGGEAEESTGGHAAAP